MDMRKTLVIWMTGLSSLFASAAQAAPSADAARPLIETSTSKRVQLKPEVEKQLRSTATRMVLKLTACGQIALAQQVKDLEQILYKGLSVEAWNNIATCLNDDKTARTKIITALTNVLNDGTSFNKKRIAKCYATLYGWKKDPNSFAKFMGDAAGKDFLNTPAQGKAASPAPK